MNFSRIMPTHKERKRDLRKYCEMEVKYHIWSFQIALLHEGSEEEGKGLGYEAYILALRTEEEFLQRALYEGKTAVDHFIACQKQAIFSL